MVLSFGKTYKKKSKTWGYFINQKIQYTELFQAYETPSFKSLSLVSETQMKMRLRNTDLDLRAAEITTMVSLNSRGGPKDIDPDPKKQEPPAGPTLPFIPFLSKIFNPHTTEPAVPAQTHTVTVVKSASPTSIKPTPKDLTPSTTLPITSTVSSHSADTITSTTSIPSSSESVAPFGSNDGSAVQPSQTETLTQPTVPVAASSRNTHSDIGIGVGVGIGLFLCLALVAAGIFLVRRRRSFRARRGRMPTDREKSIFAWTEATSDLYFPTTRTSSPAPSSLRDSITAYGHPHLPYTPPPSDR